jgi:lysophospholipase L1-like esterase
MLKRFISSVALAILLQTEQATSQAAPALPHIPPDDPRVSLIGRYVRTDEKTPRFGYPGSGFIVRFRGKTFGFDVASDSTTSALTLVVDHKEPKLTLLRQGIQTIDLADDLDDGVHTLEVYKRTETWQGLVTLLGIKSSSAELLPAPPLPLRKLLFLGDSVTCGAGIDNNDKCTADPLRPNGDPYDSYGMRLGRRLDAQVHLVCYGGRGLERDYRGLTQADGILNLPQFMDLAIATDDPKKRVPWSDIAYTPDGIVLSVGTNDFNLQTTKPLDGKQFVKDYVALLHRILGEYPNARIFATEGAIVTNPLLRTYVQQAVVEVNQSRAVWAPSTHYPGNGCNGHPTRSQHAHMTDDFEPILRDGLHW